MLKIVTSHSTARRFCRAKQDETVAGVYWIYCNCPGDLHHITSHGENGSRPQRPLYPKK